METFYKMANTQAILFLYILVGYYCRKAGIFDDVTRDKLSDFIIRISLPCMIFQSFHMDFDAAALKRGAEALAISTAMALISLVLGKVLYNRFPAQEKSIMQYGTLVSNSGFAGLPVVSGAYGEEGLFLGSIFIIPTRILMWSAGISLFQKEGSRWERAKKVLLNPAIIAVELGLLRMLAGISLPGFLNTAMDQLGECTSPLGMAMVGAILADVELEKIFEVKALYLAAVRQILLPAICLVGLRLLGAEALLTGVSTALIGMPIGSTTAILAQMYGADAQFASKCVFLSTVTSLITVPILTLFI